MCQSDFFQLCFCQSLKGKVKTGKQTLPFFVCQVRPKMFHFLKTFQALFTDRKFQIKGLNEVKELIRILLISCNHLNHVALFVEKIYSWWQCSKITEKTVCLTLGLLTSGKLQIIFSSYYFDRKTEVS